MEKEGIFISYGSMIHTVPHKQLLLISPCNLWMNCDGNIEKILQLLHWKELCEYKCCEMEIFFFP